MATKPTKTSTVKAKSAEKTSAPKVSRARKSETDSDATAQTLMSGAQAATPSSGTRMPALARDQVALRAYERFIARGYQHGHDVEDWLAAEREIGQRP